MGGSVEGRTGDRPDEPTLRSPDHPPAVGRLLAVDWGERRFGLALSDESQTLAQPLVTLTRRAGRRAPLHALLHHLEAHDVVGVVVGLPLDETGAERAPARAARALAAQIARRGGRPVALWDERYTTARVRRAVRELGGKTRRRGGRKRGRAVDVDALAATLLLQHYLDSRHASGA
jgi:putative Holliday junction resolvase